MSAPADLGRIVAERHGDVAVITIAHAPTRNSITTAMAAELTLALLDADKDPDIGAVVVTGADGDFSSGHNIHELRRHPETAKDEAANAAFSLPRRLTKPALAAIDGAAYGGGLILALACDLRIAAPTAKFCASGSRLGLLPIGGQLAWLPHLTFPGAALEMLLTGDPIDGARAEKIGLVSRLVPTERLLDETIDLADRIAGNSRSVVASIKRGVGISLLSGIATAEDFETADADQHQDQADAEHRLSAAIRPTTEREAI